MAGTLLARSSHSWVWPHPAMFFRSRETGYRSQGVLGTGIATIIPLLSAYSMPVSVVGSVHASTNPLKEHSTLTQEYRYYVLLWMRKLASESPSDFPKITWLDLNSGISGHWIDRYVSIHNSQVVPWVPCSESQFLHTRTHTLTHITHLVVVWSSATSP